MSPVVEPPVKSPFVMSITVADEDIDAQGMAVAPGFINVAYVSKGATPEAVEAAYEFFNYLLGPVFGERIGEQGRYATVTGQGQDGLSAEVKEEIFLKYIDDLGKLVDFMVPPVDPDTGKLNYDQWVTIWNEVKAA